MVCANCGGEWEVRDLSFDMDLPLIRLCGLCSILIVTDMEEFDRLGERKLKRDKK
jgi:hypothetical protein